MRALALTAVIVLALPTVTHAQAFLDVPNGFVTSRIFTFDPSVPFARQIGGLAYAPDGGVLVYENSEIRILRDDQEIVLATIEPAVFGSFLVVSADGERVMFGENSTNRILEVPIAGGAPRVVDEVLLNFDLVFAPDTANEAIAGRGFLSGFGSSPRNSIWLLDSDPDADNDEIVADVSPFSGPITFDPDGNLYVATAGRLDPDTQLNSEVMVRFSAEQLASAIGDGVLALSDGVEVVDGFDGLFNLVWHDGKLHGTNLGFSTGVGIVRSYDPEDGFSSDVIASVVIGSGSGSASLLAARPGISSFEPGSGANGGALLVAYSNFDDTSVVDEIQPELWFVRGDTNGDSVAELTDAVNVLDWLFFGGASPSSLEASDVNNDGRHDVADAVYLLNFLFRGGPSPAEPFPGRGPAL